MITLRYYLDTRATEEGAAAPLKLCLTKRSKSVLVKVGVSLLPSEWDAKRQEVIRSPRKRIINAELARLKTSVEDFLRPKIYSGELAPLTAQQIRGMLVSFIDGDHENSYTMSKLWEEYILQLDTAGSQSVYRIAWSCLTRYDRYVDGRKVCDISNDWVEGFIKFLKSEGHAANTISNKLSCTKAVLNFAVSKGIILFNPMRGVQTRIEAGKSRALTREKFLQLWNSHETGSCQPLDLFKLSFLLRAINVSDLLGLDSTNISNGRIYYTRNKTHKLYSVKVEPEALAIIEKYRCKDALFKSPTTHSVNLRLHKIGATIGVPNLTTYWARHSLASFAFEIGIPVGTVSAMLGHSIGAKVTMGYIDIREKQVDDAMRSIIDWLGVK